ncbi:MAG: glutamate formimidoyltransferase [Vicinamibacterales bacterium]
MPWLECVPNVSEGRDPAVIDRLADALSTTPGVALLDVHRDAVHHRAVFTCIGEAAALQAGIVRLVGAAIETIDLRQHHGAHPRIGAVDVVPFVPIGASTMDDAIAAARATADAVAAAHQVPVLLYEHAASAPHRRRLEHVRRGQFEGLAAKLRLPEWRPDAGPDVPHPTAGAIAMGARRLLVAWNINLATDRLEVATAVARAIRESSGGLPAVKAMGLALPDRGVVQVSMNLVDVDITPMHVVYDAVAREAARHGVAIHESELIGLVPASALGAVAADRLRIAGWQASRVLDARLVAGR